MSRNTKVLTLGVIILLVIAGFYYWRAHVLAPTSLGTASTTTPATVSATSGPGTLPTQRTSNAALEQDLSVLDAQLSGLGTDTATVNAIMNYSQNPQ